MNLKEIRQEINSALDYNPDLKQYDDNLTRVINRHYLQISSQYQWLFMQKRFQFLIRADILGSTTNTITSVGARRLSLPTSASSVNLPKDIEGQTFVLNNQEFLITRRIDARTFVVDIDIPAGSYTSWEIRYTKYPMPRDCVEVLGIMDRGISFTETIPYTGTDAVDYTSTKTTKGRNRGRFMFLDARKEENLYLDRVDTGDPFVSIEEMHSNLQPPDYAPSLSTDDITGTLFLEGDSFVPARGLAKDQVYEYCYTFLFAGMESPPSPTASISTAGFGTDTSKVRVIISKLMDTSALRDPSTTKDTGRLKKIYRRLVEPVDGFESMTTDLLKNGVGNWRHIGTVDENDTTFSDEGHELAGATVLFSDFVAPSGDIFEVSRLNEIGPRQFLRLWYTPKDDYMVEARYHKRPFRLVNDADAPEWPIQYHHYLVYSSLKDICLQHGLATYSQVYEARAKDLLERMKNKYLSRTDRMYVRRGFDRAMADRERFGIPSKS